MPTRALRQEGGFPTRTQRPSPIPHGPAMNPGQREHRRRELLDRRISPPLEESRRRAWWAETPVLVDAKPGGSPYVHCEVRQASNKSQVGGAQKPTYLFLYCGPQGEKPAPALGATDTPPQHPRRPAPAGPTSGPSRPTSPKTRSGPVLRPPGHPWAEWGPLFPPLPPLISQLVLKNGRCSHGQAEVSAKCAIAARPKGV